MGVLDELTQQAPVETEVEAEQRVTALELFFDLVFVFAITQVTAFIYRDPTWLRLLQAFAILMVLWFAWSGYVWLGNTAATDGGAFRVVLLAAMAPLLVASLAVPHAFGDDALVFGVAYFLVRALHLCAYTVQARGDPALAAASSSGSRRRCCRRPRCSSSRDSSRSRGGAPAGRSRSRSTTAAWCSPATSGWRVNARTSRSGTA